MCLKKIAELSLGLKILTKKFSKKAFLLKLSNRHCEAVEIENMVRPAPINPAGKIHSAVKSPALIAYDLHGRNRVTLNRDLDGQCPLTGNSLVGFGNLVTGGERIDKTPLMPSRSLRNSSGRDSLLQRLF